MSSTPHLVDIIEFRTTGPLLTRDFLHQKYTIERLSMSQIAHLAISSTSSVHKFLKVHEIPIRRGTACRMPAKGCGLAYGKKLQGRRIVFHKREQEVIEQMATLRAKGFTYSKIADALNTMGIRTKTGRSIWCAKTVHQILMAQA